ncbi:unnamed protein product [Oikopleura dioica]|uniref:Uncharacterized protein n=1 Tax=Oikopleura dioica TaxID=34765 RepID=E4Z5C2_OIKDI|nr:unnamed protein product [Oikopleura dioica]
MNNIFARKNFRTEIKEIQKFENGLVFSKFETGLISRSIWDQKKITRKKSAESKSHNAGFSGRLGTKTAKYQFFNTRKAKTHLSRNFERNEQARYGDARRPWSTIRNQVGVGNYLNRR